MQAITIVFGCLKITKHKTLLLKTQTLYKTEGNQSQMNRKLAPRWLFFIAPEGVVSSEGGEERSVF